MNDHPCAQIDAMVDVADPGRDEVRAGLRRLVVHEEVVENCTIGLGVRSYEAAQRHQSPGRARGAWRPLLG